MYPIVIEKQRLSQIRSCKDYSEEAENARSFIKVDMFYGEATTKCLKSCIIQEDEGNIDYEELRSEPSNVFQLVL